MFIFKDRKIKDLAWFPVFSAPRNTTAKKEKALKKKATKPESAYYSFQDKYSVKHGYVPLGRSLTVPQKHDSFFAMIRSNLKERTKKEPEYNWCELIKLPCEPKEAELKVKLDVDERQIRVSGKNIPIEKPKIKTHSATRQDLSVDIYSNKFSIKNPTRPYPSLSWITK